MFIQEFSLTEDLETLIFFILVIRHLDPAEFGQICRSLSTISLKAGEIKQGEMKSDNTLASKPILKL